MLNAAIAARPASSSRQMCSVTLRPFSNGNMLTGLFPEDQMMVRLFEADRARRPRKSAPAIRSPADGRCAVCRTTQNHRSQPTTGSAHGSSERRAHVEALPAKDAEEA